MLPRPVGRSTCIRLQCGLIEKIFPDNYILTSCVIVRLASMRAGVVKRVHSRPKE